MTDLLFTHAHNFDWESNLVSAIYLNSNTSELYVVLNGGKVYRYRNFTTDAFQRFVDAESAGRHYNVNVKGSTLYRSGGFVGYVYDLNFVDETKRASASQYEVTVQVTLTTTVRVTAESFDTAASLAMDEVEKIQGCETDVVLVTGVKKL